MASALLTGCATKSAGSDYYKSKASADLELPPGMVGSQEDRSMAIPDIQGGGTATLSSYAGECKAKPVLEVLPNQDSIKLVRDGNTTWMQVKGTPAQVLPWVREFWLTKGFDIELDSPRLGILETSWLQYEDVKDGPQKKDHYRVRLEYALETGYTEIHLAQEGVIQLKGKGDNHWAPRALDRELEIEMLKRMALFLGANQVQIDQARTEEAKPKGEAVRDTGGLVHLLVPGERNAAWSRLQHAFDRLSAQVEQLPEAKDRYRVSFIDPVKRAKEQSWVSRMLPSTNGKPQQYVLQVEVKETQTVVTPLNAAGQPQHDEAAWRFISDIGAAL